MDAVVRITGGILRIGILLGWEQRNSNIADYGIRLKYYKYVSFSGLAGSTDVLIRMLKRARPISTCVRSPPFSPGGICVQF